MSGNSKRSAFSFWNQKPPQQAVSSITFSGVTYRSRMWDIFLAAFLITQASVANHKNRKGCDPLLSFDERLLMSNCVVKLLGDFKALVCLIIIRNMNWHGKKWEGKQPIQVGASVFERGTMCTPDSDDRSIRAFPISVTATAGGPLWYILLSVCVFVVVGCGSGESAENTCWGTTVATGIPRKIKETKRHCSSSRPVFSSLL